MNVNASGVKVLREPTHDFHVTRDIAHAVASSLLAEATKFMQMFCQASLKEPGREKPSSTSPASPARQDVSLELLSVVGAVEVACHLEPSVLTLPSGQDVLHRAVRSR